MAHRLLSRLALVVVAVLLGSTSVPSYASHPTAGYAIAEERSSAAVTPVGVPGRWRLVFSDEFGGTRLDLDKWRPNWLAGSDREVTKPVNSAELAAYDPRQVRVARGSLRLRAVRRDIRDNRGRRYQYASGLVESYHDYQFRYGYAEARMFLAANTDPSLGDVGSCGPNWPAFWMNGENHPQDGEIDVMECLSDDDVAWHYWWAGAPTAATRTAGGAACPAGEGGTPSEWTGSPAA